ncbi:pyridoxamine 5'-phosphate oxidase family protein [Parafrigoribacterium soli]|uniref:pyridoxamine 5'-phosphate oxidase family protein n=1 Tax=Parafrigoribacterium soli TaxID=3144663 RepID=UPI0032EB0D81
MERSADDRRHEPSGGPANHASQPDPRTRELGDAECWSVLGDSGIARLAFQTDPAGVDIMPINYRIDERRLYFRSAPGVKLTSIVRHPKVAVQVERLAGGNWFSVVLKGEAARLEFDDEIEHSGVLDLASTQAGDKFNFVRVIPDTVTGRTFPAT